MPEAEESKATEITDTDANPGTSPPDDRRSYPEDLQLSDLKLVILGSAFFVVWAVNASSLIPLALGSRADITAAAVVMPSFILPVIGQEFGATASQVQWVVATTTIVSGSLQVIAGRCCDMFGRKRAFHYSMVFLITPNILSTFMPNLASLNVCRGFAGLGISIVVPAGAGMIGSFYPAGRKRTQAFVAVTCGGVSGVSFGLVIAGAFLEYSRWTWRPSYLILGLAYLWPWAIIAWLAPADPPHAQRNKLDWLGSLLMGLSLFVLLFGFTSSQTESTGWQTPYVPALIAVSAILMGLFVLRQIRLTRALVAGNTNKAIPLIPRTLLSSDCWNLLIIYISAALAWGVTDTFWVLIAYLYLDVLELKALQAGLRLSSVLFSGLAAGFAVGLAINSIPPRALISGLSSISIGTYVLLAVRQLDWPFWKGDLWALLCLAFNTDVLVAAGLTLVSMTAPLKDGSVAVAIFQTSCRLGVALILAMATLIRTNVESNAKQDGLGPKHALTEGLRAASWFCAGLAAVAAIIILAGMRGWQKLSDVNQGTDSSIEATGLPAGPRRNGEDQGLFSSPGPPASYSQLVTVVQHAAKSQSRRGHDRYRLRTSGKISALSSAPVMPIRAENTAALSASHLN